MAEGGASGITNTSAVTVIGIGNAGCSMLAALTDLVESHETDASFTYVALDTNASDLHGTAPADAHQIELTFPDRSLDEDTEQNDYLPEIETPTHSMGTSRFRPLGRYALDNVDSFDRVYRELQDTIRDTHNQETVEGAEGAHQIWIFHSLGGGTGSGAAPLIGLVVNDIASKLQGPVAIGGIGSLPRLDALESTPIAPGGMPEYYINSYATLRELATILDVDGETQFPLEIGIASAEASAVLAGDAFQINEPPFDAYGLLGISEEAMDSLEYRRLANEFAAQTVLSLTDGGLHSGVNATGISVFDTIPGHFGSSRLFSIDGGRLKLPLDAMEHAQELHSEIQATQKDIVSSEVRIDDLRKTLQFLEAVEWQPPKEEPEDIIYDQIQAVQETVEEQRPFTKVDDGDLDRNVSRVADQITTPDQVDSEPVARFLFATYLNQLLAERRTDHPFAKAVAEAATIHREQLDDSRYPEDFPEADPRIYWESALGPFLRDRREALRQQLQELPVFGILSKQRLESRLKVVSSRYEDLAALHDEYSRLDDLKDRVDEMRSVSRRKLRDRRNEFEERLEETKERLDNHRRRKKYLERKLEARVENLSNHGGTAHSVELEVDGSQFDPEIFDRQDVKGIQSLIEDSLLSEPNVIDAIQTMTASLQERIQDRSKHLLDASDPDEQLFVHVSPTNRNYIVEALDAGSVRFIPTVDPDTIRFTKLFAPVDLSLTSEYETIHLWFTDDDRDVSEQLGDYVTDETVRRSFAYPELVDEERGTT